MQFIRKTKQTIQKVMQNRISKMGKDQVMNKQKQTELGKAKTHKNNGQKKGQKQ